MLNDAVKIAYNRGRYELATEILDKCGIAETVSVTRLRAMLHEFEEHDANDEALDTLESVPDYVISRCHKANDPMHSRPAIAAPLRSVPDGA